MRIEPLATRAFFGPDQCLTGVSYALAEARKMFRTAAPEVSWESVQAEAARVRARDGVSLLDALYAVFHQLTTGAWAPQPAR